MRGGTNGHVCHDEGMWKLSAVKKGSNALISKARAIGGASGRGGGGVGVGVDVGKSSYCRLGIIIVIYVTVPYHFRSPHLGGSMGCEPHLLHDVTESTTVVNSKLLRLK